MRIGAILKISTIVIVLFVVFFLFFYRGYSQNGKTLPSLKNHESYLGKDWKLVEGVNHQSGYLLVVVVTTKHDYSHICQAVYINDKTKRLVILYIGANGISTLYYETTKVINFSIDEIFFQPKEKKKKPEMVI